MPLDLVVNSRVHPEKRERRGLLLKLSKDEFSAQLDFTPAVQKRTDRVTQSGIDRTPLRSYLSRHSAWTDPQPAAD
jgi:hypothetical protein